MSNDEWLSATANEAADKAIANQAKIAALNERVSELEERVRELERRFEREDG